jgi:RHS repeat-associated protein
MSNKLRLNPLQRHQRKIVHTVQYDEGVRHNFPREIEQAAGEVEDGTTGRVFLNNRYDDPTFGRFVSVDPLVGMTGEAYSYGGNNPISYSDPSGLCSYC